MKNRMNINNEKGSVLIPALMIMVLLTIMGFSIAATTTMGLKVAANKKYHKTAFLSAESGLSYVMGNLNYYHDQNLTVDAGIYFPDDSVSATTYESNPKDNALPLGNNQYFWGSVTYKGDRDVPRGSGNDMDDEDKVRAYDYQIESKGYVIYANNTPTSESVVRAQFYRIGYQNK